MKAVTKWMMMGAAVAWGLGAGRAGADTFGKDEGPSLCTSTK